MHKREAVTDKKIVESQFVKKEKGSSNSDRLSYDPQKKVKIPASVVDTVGKLRKLGCLPSLPKVVIVNQHREFSANLEQVNSNKDLRALVRSLQKNLSLKGEKMVLEDAQNRLMLDFYFQYPKVNIPFTVRSRLSGSDGELDSHRIICVNARAETERLQDPFIKNRFLPVRKEEVLIARDDNRMALSSLRAFNERIGSNDKRNESKAGVTDIVLKRMFRFNAGEKTLWDHCGTFFLDRKSKKRMSSTEKFGLVGMTSYLLFCLQEVWRYRLRSSEKVLPRGAYWKKLYPLVTKGHNLRNIFDSFREFPGSKNHFFILEVEARGRENLERMFRVVDQVEKVTSLQPELERKVTLLADRADRGHKA